MYRSILQLQRVSRVASRRTYSNVPEINPVSILPTKDNGQNTVSRAPGVRNQGDKSTGKHEDKSGPGPFNRLNLTNDEYPSYTRTKGQFLQDTTRGSPSELDNVYPSYKRANKQFILDTTHGPPVPLRKDNRPPNFIRPLLSHGLSAQEKANEESINSMADLGEEIIHPKLGKGYRENSRLLDNGAFVPINFVDGPDSIVGDDAKPDHVTVYPWDWLHKYEVYRDASKFQRVKPTLLTAKRELVASAEEGSIIPDPDSHEVVLWDSIIGKHPPTVNYDEVMASDTGVGKWTRMIHNYGFCFVDGVPVCPEKTQELLERIAFIRPTHYGGFYDFTSDLTMKDTAYTSEAIGPHTDTTYFTDPAGLQMFHLLSHTEGTGGESLLVDGFWAARSLRNRYKDSLSKIAVPWHASGNDGINITPNRPYPVLTMNTNRRATQIRWNEADRGTIHPGYSQEWYEAAKTFNDRVNDPRLQYWSQLVPGRALIFDNWRVLHGRSEFTGKRRICGGYINRDDYVSRYLNTNFTREQILEKIL
ncbi:hypothetical protein SS1G_07291 [Sclerotinia sclerotiorum 1980 UF-70]|uniref:TauD/TfdA-like domain-containing protein n=1 Tax=Sclerotinia sclerotiorum (strain ATCC 18683 / 1980 / Ss-1) TaxID=665079 RepID=A7EPP2_SCLS1|nr:hypothetical protein SS1G_07291 [Sclerotinia sclerotiorum 1980 UF-70]EDO04808.1 hypothetical protein SS1G_07291 [Sclerotinia sclerotiorum 1980 UF-70]